MPIVTFSFLNWLNALSSHLNRSTISLHYIYKFARHTIPPSTDVSVNATPARFVCQPCYNFVCQPLITGRVHGALSSPYTPGDQGPPRSLNVSYIPEINICWSNIIRVAVRARVPKRVRSKLLTNSFIKRDVPNDFVHYFPRLTSCGRLPPVAFSSPGFRPVKSFRG